MNFEILLSAPDVGELEQEYVLEALRSGWVAPAGPDLAAFEREVAERAGVSCAVALASGTAALHLTLVSWDVGPGDTVVVPTFTFAATANAVRYVGADPHFVDCDRATGNIDPKLLLRALDDLAAEGRNVAAVIAVDMLGKAADYSAIEPALEARGVKLLCDAAEAFGARHAGRPVGAFGDASALSFNGNKVMTTSGGGMLLTNDEALADHARKLSTQAREPVPHYEHVEVGYNYRLSNILAALGRAQLVRLDGMIGRRREWRSRYRDLVADTPGVEVLGGERDHDDNCWLTALVIDPTVTGWAAAELTAALAEIGIESRPVWKPMHQQPVFRAASATLVGSADWLFANAITLPSGSGMGNDEFRKVSEAVKRMLWR